MSDELMNIQYGAPKCRNSNQVGSPYESRPHLPHVPMSGTLPWKWFPFKFRIRMPRVLRWVGGIVQVAVVAGGSLLLAARQTALGILVPLFMTIMFTIPCFYLAYIMDWNFKLREAICWCLGKSVQAKAEWKKTTNPETGKHIFFEYPVSKNFKLVVLNDGSQEIWNTTGDELGAELSESLGMNGFTGDAFNGDTGIAVDYSDGAYTQKINSYKPVSQGSPIRPADYSSRDSRV